MLCNPHNPTGTGHSADELAGVASAAESAGIRVIVDEIHAPLVLPGATFTPYFAVPGGDRALVLVSASKGWNLPGLKSAVAFAGSGATGDLAQLPEEVGHGSSHLAVLAHTAALSAGQDWLDGVLPPRVLTAIAHCSRSCSWLTYPQSGGIPEGRRTWPGSTSLRYVLLLRRPATPTPVVTRVLGQAWQPGSSRTPKVLLSSGPSFGAGGAYCARLNFATSASMLTEAVLRMSDAVAWME